MIISLVPSEHVLDVWPAVTDYVQNALEYTRGRYELEDVLERVENGEFLLWIAFDGERIKGCVITDMMQYPRKKFLGCPSSQVMSLLHGSSLCLRCFRSLRGITTAKVLKPRLALVGRAYLKMTDTKLCGKPSNCQRLE